MNKHKPCIGDYIMAQNYKAELAKVKKQLEIAVKALEKYTSYEEGMYVDKFYDDSIIIEKIYFNDDGETAEKALQQIKELEK